MTALRSFKLILCYLSQAKEAQAGGKRVLDDEDDDYLVEVGVGKVCQRLCVRLSGRVPAKGVASYLSKRPAHSTLAAS